MKRQPRSLVKIISGLLMVIALLWLSVSTPFVYESQQITKQALHDNPDNPDNPFSSTTEEKSESSVSTISEYLCEILQLEHPFKFIVKYFKCHPTDVYFAYHPELISPPPEA